MWLCALVTPLPQLVWREDDDVLVKDITTAGGAEGPMPWLASQWAHREKGSKVKMDQPKKKDAADKDERKQMRSMRFQTTSCDSQTFAAMDHGRG